MKTILFKNYTLLSEYMADVIAAALKNNPALILCMASGHTPALTCDILVKKIREEQIDYSSLFFFGLDEWVGLSPDNEGSCHYFFETRLFKPLQLKSSQYHLFNALAADTEAECKKMDTLISQKGGIDIMVVGIGMNGHIGFNEPGTLFSSLSHVAALDEVTTTVGQKYFTDTVVPSRGITIGPGHLQHAKKVFLLANGSKKAEVIRRTVEGAVTENFPASVMQLHKNSFVLADEEAASLLNSAAS